MFCFAFTWFRYDVIFVFSVLCLFCLALLKDCVFACLTSLYLDVGFVCLLYSLVILLFCYGWFGILIVMLWVNDILTCVVLIGLLDSLCFIAGFDCLLLEVDLIASIDVNLFIVWCYCVLLFRLVC